MRGPSVLLYPLLLLLALLSPAAHATSLQGCQLDGSICESYEACIPDGLFGQCFSEDSGDTPPLLIDGDLSLAQRALLRLELERLADEGLDWDDAKAQCVLAYYKLSVVYNLSYDTDFCNVKTPSNVLALVQRIEGLLNEEELAEEAARPAYVLVDGTDVADQANIEVEPLADQEQLNGQAGLEQALLVDEATGEAVPVIVADEQALRDAAARLDEQPVVVVDGEELEQMVDSLVSTNDSGSTRPQIYQQALAELTEAGMEEPREGKRAPSVELTDEEEKQLKQYVDDILDSKNTDVKKLSTSQLEKLIGFIVQLQEVLEKTQVEAKPGSAPELEEVVPLNSNHDGSQLLLKKDIEKFVEEDMGLDDVEHKIVKGDVQKVEGSRVYLKVGKENVTEDELYKLVSYLDEKIAEPNNLYFNEFQYEDGQLSFRIARLDPVLKKNDKRVGSASGVAQAVYKRRKDIQTLAGVEVAETGIGSGVDVVPVEKAGRDWLFLPTITICAFTISSLIIVLAVHLVRNRRRGGKNRFPEVIDCLEGKASYEELCRQRMSSHDGGLAGVGKSSSTSSWPDEALLQSCNMDVATGNEILSTLRKQLDSPEEIEQQWTELAQYKNTTSATTIASLPENAAKNAEYTVLPFDENIPLLSGRGYINASKIHDSDPNQVVYIAAQAPLADTVVDFWSCIWEQSVTLVVNLCSQEDAKRYQRYWPGEGSKIYGVFEVHLVSEHIWSEDYMVRSFYLKHSESTETRTVTQFHYLAWSENGTPASTKSLLEFRRKVNKSYRGRQSPVLVHCTSGAQRTGAYCLMDMLTSNISKSGKQLDAPAALRHLRDQRDGMVGNAGQYRLVLACVAEEVSVLLKNLQQ